MKLKAASLFAGIGGLERGLEAELDLEVIWQVEIDPFCRAVLREHWSGAKQYERVEDITAARLDADGSERPDILCGGFPCQDLSVAGSGAGLAGARSGLWFEYARIIGELRPKYVVVENVSALLGRGLGVVLGDLAALGYDCWWDCLPASALGAPHRRDRLYVVAWRVSDAERDRLRHFAKRGAGAARAPDGGHAELEHVGQNAELADADGRGCQGQLAQRGQQSHRQVAGKPGVASQDDVGDADAPERIGRPEPDADTRLAARGAAALADAESQRCQRGEPRPERAGRSEPEYRGGTGLADADGSAGRQLESLWGTSARATLGRAGQVDVADAAVSGCARPAGRTGSSGRCDVERDGSGLLADADGGRCEEFGLEGESGNRGQRGQRGDEFDRCDMPLWPPAPNDLRAWDAVPAGAQPSVCRVAYGLSLGLDGAQRVGSRNARLRALGNAVVPQVAEVCGYVIALLEEALAQTAQGQDG